MVLGPANTSCAVAPKQKHNPTEGVSFQSLKKEDVRLTTDFKSYTRLPGQQVTVRVTLFLCSFNMGTSAEWLMPTVDRPLTATIISPHLAKDKRKRTVNYLHAIRKHYPNGDMFSMKFTVSLNHQLSMVRVYLLLCKTSGAIFKPVLAFPCQSWGTPGPTSPLTAG